MTKKQEDRRQDIATLLHRWQEMTITSDPMFGLVMENKKICLELIQRALPLLKVKSIAELATQKEINVPLARRSRYDVFVRDKANRIFVVEMQVVDKHNLPARLRYYQEQVDHSLLHPGDDYQVLAKYPVYVLMFCQFDYFGRGWASYPFDLTCTRDRQLKFGDQRTIVVFNARAQQFLPSEEPIRNFLALMQNRADNKSRFISDIQKEIRRVKEDPERRRGFMKFELDLMDARREGRQEGIEQGQDNVITTVITNLRDKNYSEEQIKHQLQLMLHLSDDQVDHYLQHS